MKKYDLVYFLYKISIWDYFNQLNLANMQVILLFKLAADSDRRGHEKHGK